MEVADVKVLIRSSSNTDDAYIEAVLPLIKEGVREYLKEPFKNEADNTDNFPGLVKLAIAKWVEAYTIPAGIASQGMGSVSYSYKEGSGIPVEVRGLLDQYKRGAGTFGFVAAPSARPSIGPYREG